MAEMLDDLEEALEVEVSRAGSIGGGEVGDVLSSVPRQERFLRPGRSRGRTFLGAAALTVLIGIIVLVGGGGGGAAIALPPRAAHV